VSQAKYQTGRLAMPQTAISDLGGDALDSIHAEAITNIYDIFIMLALRRKRNKPHGYGPMTAQEIHERLGEVGIDVSVRDVQRRHKENQALFGQWSHEKETDELLRKKKQTLALTTNAAIAQADFLARAIVALGSRTQRRPSFLYRRRDWAVVPNWSHRGFTTRRATGGEIERDDAFRCEADEHRSRK